MYWLLFFGIRWRLVYLVIWLWLLLASQAYAQSTIIYEDDFEGPVSGWTVNNTEYDPDVTTFLGRFDNAPNSTSRIFSVPSNTDTVTIAFDLYRFDSWDNNAQYGLDRFEVEIDGAEIFSLPFPNPQAARSGATGTVDWNHSPLTGTVELAFGTGQWWFDQLHRFNITVNNPGATLDLTLRTDLNQGGNDESGGFDNIVVTATSGNIIIAVAETFPSINGTSGGVTTSVLSSDTLGGVILDPNDVTITSTSSSSANVALDPTTGLITVGANTLAGSYTVDYEICENINLSNCSTITETLNVTVPGGSLCPIGTTEISGTYHIVSATNHPGQNQNAERAEGLPLAEGTNETGANSAITYFGAITMDLTGDPQIVVPEGETIEIVLSSAWGTQGRAEILMSADGVTYTSLGTTGNGGSVYGAWTSNILRYDDFIVPAGGIRFLQVLQENSGVRADGVIYGAQCQPSGTPSTELSGSKSVEVYDPDGLGLYALPGNDVIYTISVDNIGSGDVDSDSMILIDALPSEVTFYNGDIDDAAGPETNPVIFTDNNSGLAFTYNTDVSFSNAVTQPANFAACNYVPATGYDAAITHLCINPKGTMLSGTGWSINFRARIK